MVRPVALLGQRLVECPGHTALGTAAYMCPEQARGRAVDQRCDVWAFGAVLYEMLAGRRAFQGRGIQDTLAAVLGQDVDWSVLPADTPGAGPRAPHALSGPRRQPPTA